MVSIGLAYESDSLGWSRFQICDAVVQFDVMVLREKPSVSIGLMFLHCSYLQNTHTLYVFCNNSTCMWLHLLPLLMYMEEKEGDYQNMMLVPLCSRSKNHSFLVQLN